MEERKFPRNIVSVRLSPDVINIWKRRKLDLRAIIEAAVRREGEPSDLIRARMVQRQAEFEAGQERDREALEAAVEREEDRRSGNLSRTLVEKFDRQFGEKVRRQGSILQTDLDQFVRDERADEYLRERRLGLPHLQRALRQRYRVEIVEARP